MAVPASPSQGLRSFLEVYARTIEFKLESIRAANSDEELKQTLLDLAQKGFRVWTVTGRWNEASTSSLSHSIGSDPLSSTSWEQVPSYTPTSHFPSPKLSSTAVFPNLEPSNPQNISSATTNVFTGHAHTIVNPANAAHSIPFPASNPSPNPRHTMPISGDYSLVAPIATELQTYYQNPYPSNIPENGQWLNQMQQIQFNNNTANYDDVGIGGGLHASDYDMGGMPHNGIPNMSAQRWEDQYSARGFARYGGAP